MKIALIQINSSSNVSQNLNKISDLVIEASKNAELIILPEHADCIAKKECEHEISIPSEVTNFYSNLAIQNDVYLHCGSIAEKSSTKPYNTSLVFSPKGEIIAQYRKLHLFDVELNDGSGYKESNGTSAGNDISICEIDDFKFGLTICYDLRFPELYRKLAIDGANVFIVSANFTENTGKYHWKPLLQARAIENGCYVIAVNQCGENALFEAHGHSIVIDPWGNVIAELENEEGILYCELDLELVKETRNKIPSLYNRRNDLY